jgi:hypothetical protein
MGFKAQFPVTLVGTPPTTTLAPASAPSVRVTFTTGTIATVVMLQSTAEVSPLSQAAPSHRRLRRRLPAEHLHGHRRRRQHRTRNELPRHHVRRGRAVSRRHDSSRRAAAGIVDGRPRAASCPRRVRPRSARPPRLSLASPSASATNTSSPRARPSHARPSPRKTNFWMRTKLVGLRTGRGSGLAGPVDNPRSDPCTIDGY